MNQLERRSYKILALAAAFFLSGVWFFLSHHGEMQEKQPVLDLNLSAISSLPDPENFFHFVHNQNQSIITIDGVCYDSYYTILIFPAKTDYRYDSLAAVYNRAQKCPKSKMFLEKINLTSLKMNFDEEYYIVKAQQGKKGTWYAPY